jgi:hypothetical protein
MGQVRVEEYLVKENFVFKGGERGGAALFTLHDAPPMLKICQN